MGWVVDHRVLAARDAADGLLRQVAEQNSYVVSRSHAVEGGTRVVMGQGHVEGDHVIVDAVQATECMRRALEAVRVALAEVRQVNIMTWEPEDQID